MMGFKHIRDAHERLDYYHGLIDKSDLEILLVEEGDFLLRIREDHKTRRPVISCMYDKNLKSDKGIVHCDVKRAKKSSWTLDGTGTSQSIAALVKHYVKYKHPVRISIPNARKRVYLLRPIRRASWELDENDITKKKKIGQGEFGEVMAGTLLLKTRKKVDVAIKIAKPGTNQNKVAEFFTEARLMRSFDHPNVVKLYGVVYEPIMLVMELIPEGSLDKYLKKNRGSVTDDEKLDRMVMGAAWGFEYLHSKNCIHRDIACRNCLVSKKEVKISDFGLTKKGVTYILKEICNLPVRWMSPETLDSGKYTQKSDVFSFGIMIWEIFADGTEPFLGMTNEEVQKAVVEGLRPEFDDASDELIDFVNNKMWEEDPDDRLTMSEICRGLEKLVSKEPKIPAANKKIIRALNKADTTCSTECSREETIATLEEDVNKPTKKKPRIKKSRSKTSSQTTITSSETTED